VAFSDVDASENPARLVGYLDRVDVNAAEIRAELRQLMGSAPDGVIVDLGAGVGHDAIALSQSGRRVVGVEPSQTLIAEAKARTARSGVSPGLVRAVGEALPFPAASIGACLVDRVLQHVDDPAVVLAELHRVLAPGGRLVVFDVDWGTLSIDLDDLEAIEAIARCQTAAVAQGRIGLHLRGLLLRAGFVEVDCRPIPQEVTRLADTTLRFDLAVARTVRAGLLSEDRAERLQRQMTDALENGTFWASYNRYLAVAARS
jgi:SAM-dependent methyltransferase